MSDKNKAQGMYPTPTALVKRLVRETFVSYANPPKALLEPSAGFGVFILEAWNYWLHERKVSKAEMRNLVSNTWAFENDGETFSVLRRNIASWCRTNGIDAKAQLKESNFLTNIAKISSRLPDELVTLGNPPWDEFTTRKHDTTGDQTIRKIRDEREREKSIFAPLGIKNLYQAFVHCLLEIPSKKLEITFVLPRQILGDMASAPLRAKLIEQGKTNITVYRNKDTPDYFFEAVDSNFEIAVIQFKRSHRKNQDEVCIRRGFDSKFQPIAVTGSDFTIPCPPSNELASTLNKLLSEMSFGSWSEKRGVSVSRGKTTSESKNYSTSANGRTLKAYQIDGAMRNSRLVLNKILPNSRRKLKAGMLAATASVSDSLVMVDSNDKELYPYLVLMFNSRAIELALRSLTSNINLNNFRLLSLPIPEPDAKILEAASRLFNLCAEDRESWEKASDELTKMIFSLNQRDQKSLQDQFPERTFDKNEDIAA